ncbi:MAG: CCA tRNA nucleotidyltransferase [Proteobacteria bacterium]|jgi:poly(A) polymerase|nr:CCA tRNA nucleotidyltransferase [Pseudomonadota bacterium]MDA1238152.1 CCA tRNA nucleotidyltransferase [Pseudomonadota bacterium]
MKLRVGGWIHDPDLQTIFHMFIEAGHKIYCVGGCVRNSLLQEPIEDIDLATTAKPLEIIKLAKNTGLRSIPTGFSHGTVTVICNKKSFEVTTFRDDIKTDGRHAEIVFSNDILIDAQRRDFTINALYADTDGYILDPLNSLKDIKSKTVRFINDPNKRILEDNLRILRFFRFYAWYGNLHQGLHSDDLKACRENREKIKSLSKDRVGGELKKLLSAPNPEPALLAMKTVGILEIVLPNANIKKIPSLVILEKEIDINWISRMYIIGATIPKGLWSMSKKENNFFTLLETFLAGDETTAHISYLHGRDVAFQVSLLRGALYSIKLSNSLEADIERGINALFPITSGDLIPEFNGKELGDKLRALKLTWLKSNFSLTKDELLS